VIIVYKVIKMDIYQTKTHHFASEGLYLTSRSLMDYFYNGWMCFLELQKLYSLPLAWNIYQFNTTPVVFG